MADLKMEEGQWDDVFDLACQLADRSLQAMIPISIRTEAEELRDHPGGGHDLLVSEHDALGPTGRARRVQHVGEVIGTHERLRGSITGQSQGRRIPVQADDRRVALRSDRAHRLLGQKGRGT